MYEIKQINYSYYSELAEFLNQMTALNRELIQIIDIDVSSDNKRLYQATIIFKKRGKFIFPLINKIKKL